MHPVQRSALHTQNFFQSASRHRPNVTSNQGLECKNVYSSTGFKPLRKHAYSNI